MALRAATDDESQAMTFNGVRMALRAATDDESRFEFAVA